MTTYFDMQSPPWPTSDLWQEANEIMAATVHHHRRRLKSSADLAMRVVADIEGMDVIMDTLCSATCPSCEDPCCGRATIWYDFKDLIVMHLAGSDIPDAQIVRPAGQPCAHQTSAGCVLPRTSRPFICTWYLCPAQKSNLLPNNHDQGPGLIRKLERLKLHRKKIEHSFIQVVGW